MLLSRWIPHTPHPKPASFLLHDEWFEGLYGGAAGGAKSDTLLMAAAQYLHVPGYAALLLRRTFRDLNQPDALIPRSKTWWYDKADWNSQEKRWTFPSGATVTFGYLEHEDDVYQYQGAAYQFVGFDELTQFTESQYLYLASRIRKPAGGALADVPLRLRAASNPGGVGHEWVKKRFLPVEFLKASEEVQFSRSWYKEGRFFVPARLEDNPSLDLAQYERGLALLDPVTRAQLRKGDWKAHAGGRFNPRWWRYYRDGGDHYKLEDDPKAIPRPELPRVVTCDPANRKTKASKYTAAGVFGDAGQQRVLVLDMIREQLSVEEIVPRLNTLARRWDPLQWLGIEANGFQIALVKEARDRRHEYMPTVYELDPEGKSKLTRATPAIIRCEQGLMYLPDDPVKHPWVDDYIAELGQFTGSDEEDGYTDQVDVTAYAVLGLDRFSAGHDAEPVAGRRRAW